MRFQPRHQSSRVRTALRPHSSVSCTCGRPRPATAADRPSTPPNSRRTGSAPLPSRARAPRRCASDPIADSIPRRGPRPQARRDRMAQDRNRPISFLGSVAKSLCHASRHSGEPLPASPTCPPTHCFNPIHCDRACVLRLHRCGAAEQMGVPSVAPSVDRHHVEIACVGIRRRKTASNQFRKQRIEIHDRLTEPTRSDLGRNITRIDAKTHGVNP